ncbi:MAG TPA: hypothetical protein VHZ03_29015, partial [Trebonia sp.]|nr:hypothetical protein [Trebonia sp.]
VLADADPDDKAEIFRQLGLKLTYNPGERLVRATVEPASHWQFDGVRGRPGGNPLFGDFMHSW